MDVPAILRSAWVVVLFGGLPFGGLLFGGLPFGSLTHADNPNGDEEPLLAPRAQGPVHPLIDDLRAGDPIRLAITGVDGATRLIQFDVEGGAARAQASVDVEAAPFVRSDFVIALTKDGLELFPSPHRGGLRNEPMVLRWAGSPLAFEPGDYHLGINAFDHTGNRLRNDQVDLTVGDYPAPWTERELAAAGRSAVSVLLRRSEVEPGWLMITGSLQKRSVGVITTDAAGSATQYQVCLDSAAKPVSITAHPLTTDLFRTLWPDPGALVFGADLGAGTPTDRAGDGREKEGPFDSRITFERFGPPGQFTIEEWNRLQQAVRRSFVESVRPKTRKEARATVMSGGAASVPALINALHGMDLSKGRDLVNAGNLVLAIQSVTLDLVKIPLRLDILEIEENRDFNVKVVHSLVRYWEKYDGTRIREFEEKLARQEERLRSMPDDW